MIYLFLDNIFELIVRRVVKQRGTGFVVYTFIITVGKYLTTNNRIII